MLISRGYNCNVRCSCINHSELQIVFDGLEIDAFISHSRSNHLFPHLCDPLGAHFVCSQQSAHDLLMDVSNASLCLLCSFLTPQSILDFPMIKRNLLEMYPRLRGQNREETHTQAHMRQAPADQAYTMEALWQRSAKDGMSTCRNSITRQTSYSTLAGPVVATSAAYLSACLTSDN